MCPFPRPSETRQKWRKTCQSTMLAHQTVTGMTSFPWGCPRVGAGGTGAKGSGFSMAKDLAFFFVRRVVTTVGVAVKSDS